MGPIGRQWRFSGVLAASVCLGSAVAASSQFTSYNDRSRSVLEGNWQSCREADGTYSERIYDGKLPGIGPFELHMGPYHEFALFLGVQEAHRDHAASGNLLRPYTVEVRTGSGRQRWEAAGLYVDVALAGGSREDCESWWVTLKRAASSSSH